MVRFNITIPDDIAKQLKKIQNKSNFISETLREKFEREKKEKLNEILAQAYQQVREEDIKVTEDWDTATGDGLK